MDKALQINRNYYSNAVAYLNAAIILADGYDRRGIEETNPMYVLQIWPLYYLLALSAEMALKAGLMLSGIEQKTIRNGKTGHDLDWLLNQYIEKVSRVDRNLDWMIRALNKGEFRYTEFYGDGAHITIIPHRNFFSLLQELIQKDQTEFLKRAEGMAA